MILLRQRLPLRDHQAQLRLRVFQPGLAKGHLLIRRGVLHKARQQSPIVCTGLQYGAVFLRVDELIQQGVHLIEGIVPLNVAQAVPQIIQVVAVNAVAFLNGVDMRLHG